MHESVRLECPVEIIETTQINPLISKCEIKVCYVGEDPNRNGSIITKEVAREMASSLRGSPIVGQYNEETQDFEEHNRAFELNDDGQYVLKDTTRPYGFVDLNAKCWFAKYLDDGEVEHEYLMTEGYIWTGQYPEVQRIIDKGNNQSMELDEKSLKANWADYNNKNAKFFIINEAIISKLCILGEDYEPCFEGASIKAPQLQFSLGEKFQNELLSMMTEFIKIMNKEEQEVYTKYAVEIGDVLWNSLWDYLFKKYPATNDCYGSAYRIEGIYEENSQKFAVIQSAEDQKFYRMDFSIDEANGFVPSETLIEVTKSYTPAEEPQFALEAVKEFEAEYKKKKVEEEDEDKSSDNEGKSGKDEEPENEEDKEEDEPSDEDKKKKKKYSYNELEEIPEYVELLSKFNALSKQIETLTTQNAELLEFRNGIEKRNKEAMISSFYMLSDEDKKDVIENIDNYSLDEIEAKLSVICVRNKVNFSIDKEEEDKGPTTYSFEDMPDDAVPAWVKSVRATAKSMD